MNYNKDKSGWVTFTNRGKMPKIKLRSYILGLSKKLSKITLIPLKKVRSELIDIYNSKGLEGVQAEYNRIVIKFIQDEKHNN